MCVCEIIVCFHLYMNIMGCELQKYNCEGERLRFRGQRSGLGVRGQASGLGVRVRVRIRGQRSGVVS